MFDHKGFYHLSFFVVKYIYVTKFAILTIFKCTDSVAFSTSAVSPTQTFPSSRTNSMGTQLSAPRCRPYWPCPTVIYAFERTPGWKDRVDEALGSGPARRPPRVLALSPRASLAQARVT